MFKIEYSGTPNIVNTIDGMWHSAEKNNSANCFSRGTLPTRKIEYLPRRGSTEPHGAIDKLISNLIYCYECIYGMWRSLVAHLAWDEGVARSNRVIPTI